MPMTSCDPDTSVPDWIIEHPERRAAERRLCQAGTDIDQNGENSRAKVLNVVRIR